MSYEKSYKGRPLADLTGDEPAYIRYLNNIIRISRAHDISLSNSTCMLDELTIEADSIHIERISPDIMANIYTHYESMYPAPKPRIIFGFPGITGVIFNDPATIVFWGDGSKTVVKCQDDDVFDPEKGLAMAISKKALGNKSNFNNEFKKWLPEEPTMSLSSAEEHTFTLNVDPDIFKNAFKGLTAFGDRKKEYDKGYKDGMFAKECDRDGDCYGCKFDRPPKDSKHCEGCCRNYADGYVKGDE